MEWVGEGDLATIGRERDWKWLTQDGAVEDSTAGESSQVCPLRAV